MIYKTDPKWVASQNYSGCVQWAIYSHRQYLHTKRHGFTMAAAEYKTDRETFLRRARILRPKGLAP
jgi:hypothetical protein|uniref:Uncharacterized protein n=1 Tax=Myoviridae sp. ctshb19 TaxID=2825194 RepID=A0A8S5UGU4_9CAUD|nr:MAG TPA: hypothetical protein [Myoviridae sp. ctshb19]